MVKAGGLGSVEVLKVESLQVRKFKRFIIVQPLNAKSSLGFLDLPGDGGLKAV